MKVTFKSKFAVSLVCVGSILFQSSSSFAAILTTPGSLPVTPALVNEIGYRDGISNGVSISQSAGAAIGTAGQLYLGLRKK